MVCVSFQCPEIWREKNSSWYCNIIFWTNQTFCSLLCNSQTESWVEVFVNCGAAVTSSSAAADHHLALVLSYQAGYSDLNQFHVLFMYTCSRLNPAMQTHMPRHGQMPEPKESQCFWVICQVHIISLAPCLQFSADSPCSGKALSFVWNVFGMKWWQDQAQHLLTVWESFWSNCGLGLSASEFSAKSTSSPLLPASHHSTPWSKTE